MDVVVIDSPTKWGMLLSRKWETDVGGSIQMDWSYDDIPVTPRYKVRLFREKKMLHNVKDPRNWKTNLYILRCLNLTWEHMW